MQEAMQHSSRSKNVVHVWRVAAITFSVLATLSFTGTPAFAAPTLDEVAADFGLNKDDVRQVHNGELVNTTTRETCDRELAVVMVFLVKTPVQKLVASFKGSPSPRNDPQVQSVTEINAEGTFAESKSVVLQPGGDKETQRYLNAALGDTLYLSIAEIASFAALKAAGSTGQIYISCFPYSDQRCADGGSLCRSAHSAATSINRSLFISFREF
jgi:hypothetical protein